MLRQLKVQVTPGFSWMIHPQGFTSAAHDGGPTASIAGMLVWLVRVAAKLNHLW